MGERSKGKDKMKKKPKKEKKEIKPPTQSVLS